MINSAIANILQVEEFSKEKEREAERTIIEKAELETEVTASRSKLCEVTQELTETSDQLARIRATNRDLTSQCDDKMRLITRMRGEQKALEDRLSKVARE